MKFFCSILLNFYTFLMDFFVCLLQLPAPAPRDHRAAQVHIRSALPGVRKGLPQDPGESGREGPLLLLRARTSSEAFCRGTAYDVC